MSPSFRSGDGIYFHIERPYIYSYIIQTREYSLFLRLIEYIGIYIHTITQLITNYEKNPNDDFGGCRHRILRS